MLQSAFEKVLRRIDRRHNRNCVKKRTELVEMSKHTYHNMYAHTSAFDKGAHSSDSSRFVNNENAFEKKILFNRKTSSILVNYQSHSFDDCISVAKFCVMYICIVYTDRIPWDEYWNAICIMREWRKHKRKQIGQNRGRRSAKYYQMCFMLRARSYLLKWKKNKIKHRTTYTLMKLNLNKNL